MVESGNGKSVSLVGVGIIFKVFGRETGGAFAVVEYNPVEPGRLVPPHMHTREDECSFVLEGDIGVRVAIGNSRRAPVPTSSSHGMCHTLSGTRGRR